MDIDRNTILDQLESKIIKIQSKIFCILPIIILY